MPTHWTYADFVPTDSLEQGDLLEPSDALRDILREVHPHFINPKYLGFLVLTQSCDLVERGRQACSTRYVTLCVVRSLQSVVADFLETACSPKIAVGVYPRSTKGRAVDLLSRIVNQNESALGIFYLHPDGDLGIGDPAVAMLRVSVALRVQHYNILRLARRGRLAPEFQNKLGWLVGNLYSRVGTTDWHEDQQRSRQMQQLVSSFLDSEDAPLWVSADEADAAKAAGVNLSVLNRADISKTLIEHKPPPVRDEIIDEVLQETSSLIPMLDPGSGQCIPLWQAQVGLDWYTCDAALAASLAAEGRPVRLNPRIDKVPSLNSLKQRLNNNHRIQAALRRARGDAS